MSLSEWLVRNVTYPLHERVRGYDTLGILGDLRRLSACPPAYVQDHVRQRLREQLRFAAIHLPFYTERFARHDVNFRAADPAAELLKLPILTKAEIHEHAERMRWAELRGGKMGCTGGTTGDRLHFLVDSTHGAQGLASRFFMQEQFGVRFGDRRMYLWGSPIELGVARVKRLRDRFLNEIMLNAFDMGAADMDAHIARIRKFKPRLIYGYPSALALLAQHAAAQWGPDAFPFLKVIVATGEGVTDDQRRQISSVFGCPVAAEYGAREIGLIAHDCPHGRTHIQTPNVHVTILNGGKPAAPGEVGEVVCTVLNSRAQPLIHYRLGDLARLETEACPCGLPLPTLRVESGKVLGFIALPGGRLCNGAVTSHILRTQPGIVHYRTHQRTVTDFDIYIVKDDEFDPATPERVKARYRELFGEAVQVTFHFVDAIPPDPSGKRRYVISDVAADYSQFEVVSVAGAVGE